MKLPVTVIGGYLGAGKTTLINHLLRNANGRRLAVLVNEFGELSIDEDLIEAEEDGLMSISGGCVCCAYGSDMIGVLEDIRDADPPFDNILLEASGVALPASIMVTVGLVQGLRGDATVVLADTEQIRKNARHKFLSDTILNQLAQADIILMTKPDLVDDATRDAVREWLTEQAPKTRIIEAPQNGIAPEAVIGAVPFAAQLTQAPTQTHVSFASTVLEPSGAIDAEALANRLAQDPSITRAKGFVQTPKGMALIHIVGHRAEVEEAMPPQRVGVVCIGLRNEFDADAVQRLV